MRKSLVLAALLAVVALAQNPKPAATERSEWIKFNPVTPLTAASFSRPPAADLPWVRMNMPATADPAEIAAEVREMREKGIAGVEIGQGAFPNNDQLVALYHGSQPARDQGEPEPRPDTESDRIFDRQRSCAEDARFR